MFRREALRAPERPDVIHEGEDTGRRRLASRDASSAACPETGPSVQPPAETKRSCKVFAGRGNSKRGKSMKCVCAWRLGQRRVGQACTNARHGTVLPPSTCSPIPAASDAPASPPRPSSSGLGRRPFTAETRVRFPLGVPAIPEGELFREPLHFVTVSPPRVICPPPARPRLSSAFASCLCRGRTLARSTMSGRGDARQARS